MQRCCVPCAPFRANVSCPATSAALAYDDGALPIGKGQTISQPYIVARMTEALGLPEWQAAHGGQRPNVLDVGTGSGYQAAILDRDETRRSSRSSARSHWPGTHATGSLRSATT